MPRAHIVLAVLCAALLPAAVSAQHGVQAYRALGLKPQEVLSGTVLQSRVLPGDAEQVVCIATYFTGKEQKGDEVNVRLGVFNVAGDDLVSLYQRDFGEEYGGNIANGDLLLLDIDRDGVNEIIVSYDDYGDPLIQQRIGEIILHDGAKLTTGWSGFVEYDATKAAREVPQERRDRYVREFEWGKTIRTSGVTLFVNKKVIAIAGETLAEPRVVEETFQLRGKPANS